MSAWGWLLLAVAAEVAATSALKASAGFTRLWPSLAVVAGYGAAFWLLTLVLREMPLGVTYAVWSGLGIVLLALVGFVAYREAPDWPAVIGMALIIAGVVVIRLFSKVA